VSAGNADKNQQLSDRPTPAMTACLQWSWGIALFSVSVPAETGKSDPAAFGETLQEKGGI